MTRPARAGASRTVVLSGRHSAEAGGVSEPPLGGGGVAAEERCAARRPPHQLPSAIRTRTLGSAAFAKRALEGADKCRTLRRQISIKALPIRAHLQPRGNSLAQNVCSPPRAAPNFGPRWRDSLAFCDHLVSRPNHGGKK